MTDPTEPRPSRHRRSRGTGDPETTGSIPVVRTESGLPDPMIEYRHPERLAGDFIEIRYGSGAPPADQAFTDPLPRRRHRAPAAEPITAPATEPIAAPGTAGSPADLTPTDANPVPGFEGHRPPPAGRARRPAPVEPAVPEPAPVVAGLGGFDILDEHSPAGAGILDEQMPGDPPPSGPPADGDDAPAGLPVRRRRGKALIAVGALLAVLAVVAVLGIRQYGGFGKDFDSTTGSGGVLVQIPEQASLRQFGTILTDAGVVGSRQAFVSAAGGGTLSAGFYNLPTGISADTAVAMMSDDSHRVGRVVIPEGLQLDAKKGVDGKTTPGVFELLADATAVRIGDRDYGVTVAELEQAAAKTPAADLGVPAWATAPVARLTGDHRRIEGLIASGAWEDIDPRLDATALLRSLITRSAARFAEWGLLDDNDSGLLPYDTLVVASIVEREVSREGDYAKVARVILNRLDAEQKLEMDSTVNYTAAVTNIDVHGETFADKTEWNTYQRDGLPVTPIGAVGERALEAVEKPAAGDWLYFVTVDKQGTTLFAKTFEKHKQNRQVACKNKLITTGCE